jgi:hypothetical protein
MGLRTLILPSGRLKKQLEVDEAMFQSVERPCELIFWILDNERSDLHEIACDVLSRRMALRIHNLLSEPL